MRAPEVDFDRAPKLGYILKIDGLMFELVEIEPHVRRDGTPTQLLTWNGYCVDCGAPFQVKTGLRSKSLTKRCAAHRAKGKPATAAAQARLNDSGIIWARYRR